MFKLFERGFKSLSMGEAMKEVQQNPGIRLIDVRTPAEYRQGHIPGAVSLPLDQWQQIQSVVPDKTTPLYVYCLSGARSQSACQGFVSLGYTSVTNIGGIGSYAGSVER